MKIAARAFPFLLLFASFVCHAADIQRFPPPDFESGYAFPQTVVPAARSPWLGYMDIAVLVLAMSVAAFFVLKKRSRRGVFGLTVFSIAYFGFYRQGCICSIGSIQNVTLALFDSTYAIPLAAIAFFALPLIFSLFFGRVFCSGVCTLGAMQDMVLIKPVKVPAWLQQALGVLAYLYLGAAVLFAAMGSAFIICQYDPFISFYRMSGNQGVILFGAVFLLVGLFVGRPYCRFFCPYGVLLKTFSRFTKWRVTVAPEPCTLCRSCDDACPYGYITPATHKRAPEPSAADKKRPYIFLALAPILVLLCGWIFSLAGGAFAHMDYRMQLAERIALEESDSSLEYTDASKSFRDTGGDKQALYEEAQALRGRYTAGAWFLGCFMGLVFAWKLVSLSLFRRRAEYEIEYTDCVACGRCFSYCPINTKGGRTEKNATPSKIEPLAK